MATTSTIGTSSRNYSTIALWLAAFATGGWIGECYNDTEFAPGAQISFSGHSTNATDYITLKCAAGQSFRDNANVQTNATRYNQSNGVGVKGNFVSAALVYINEDYVTIDGLQLWQSRAYAGKAVIEVGTTSATHSVVNGNILVSGGDELLRPKSGLFRNNLWIFDPSGTGKDLIKAAYPGTVIMVNNTIVIPSDAANKASCTVFNFYGTPSMTFKNNALFGVANLGTTTGITGSNNASDLAISFGSDQASKTYANQFTNTTVASGDFKVKNSSADLYNNGTTDTTNIPAANDIALTSRPQSTSWDIGCWELVVGGGATFIPGWATGATRSVGAVF